MPAARNYHINYKKNAVFYGFFKSIHKITFNQNREVDWGFYPTTANSYNVALFVGSYLRVF